MKTIIATLCLTITSLFIQAQTGTDITVTVPVTSDKGNIVIGLYDEATFMKAPPIKGLEAEIVDGQATATFTNVPAGTYAISLFQDKNLNKRMDFEPTGMPAEPYGVSNNVMSMGPPQWSDAKFEVGSEKLTLEIRM
ncbi:DUF2141 domain-containing protein [Altibacter sp. HG106]|uniref:DUF2141 domain-containing protein n=1 Tax=Altibacter sp. HG106 TaxID=3023937 RepID=UPI00234FCD5E|nr:DUF2141 domain-containing protein [Altibacter sp. HG106]MDC7993843.1 DUF2141 domain-containing protein [Altibacter sp. HG106]